MWFSGNTYHFFWLSCWSRPLRAACPHLSEPQQQKAHTKLPIPAWLRSIYVLYGIGQAIAERAAWLLAQPTPPPFHFTDSAPCWSKMAAMLHDPRLIQRLIDEDLLLFFEVKLEQLLRVMRADPNEIGQDRWTQVALGVCGHLMQGYHEFQRRCGTQQARALVRAILRAFVLLGREPAEAAEPLVGAPSAARVAAPVGAVGVPPVS